MFEGASFRLGEWTVRPAEGDAINGAAAVRLEPKVMAVLVYLAERAGRVVAKEEILGAIWGDVHVTDVVLARGVSEIRRLLGDDARAPRLIETLPKRGYRMIAEVAPIEPEVTPVEPAKRSVVRWLLPVGVLLLAGLAASWWWPPAPPPSSVAVAPFRNLSGDPSSDYFATGVTEDILTALFKVRELRVIPPGASDRGRFGRRTRAASMLEGSVRRDGQRVRVDAQLVDAATAEILWRESYDRGLEGIFDIQRDIAGRIAEALEVELSPQEQRRLGARPTAQMAAHDLYLRGRENYRRYQADANEAAIELFQRAVELDPRFALAHAGLANAYGLRMANYGFGLDQAELAIAAAERARELEPELPEAYKALGIAYAQQGWSRLALRAYDRALQLRPDYDEAIHNSTFLRQQLGQWDSAGRWQRRLESLPLKLK